MIRNFWYAVAASNDLRDRPLAVRVLGHDVVLFRTAAGAAACLTDRCAHRGDQLSRGTVEGDCLRCPYHHWAWKSDGACADIPSNRPGDPIPDRARVASWDVAEGSGWVFVFVGDLPEGKRPPLPTFPELSQPGWRVFDFTFDLDAHYSRVVENAVDMSHLPFLHRATYGPDQIVACELEDHTRDEWQGSGSYNHATALPPPLGWILRKPIASRTTFAWQLPCYTTTRAVTKLGTVLLVMCHLPVDDGRTRILYRLARDFATWPPLDILFEKTARKVFAEDRISVEKQLPHRAPPDPADEVQVRADAFPLGFRKARQAALRRGWGVEAQCGAAKADTAKADTARADTVPSDTAPTEAQA